MTDYNELKQYLESTNTDIDINIIHQSWYKNKYLIQIFKDTISNIEHCNSKNIEYIPRNIENILHFLKIDIDKIDILVLREYPNYTNREVSILKHFGNRILLLSHKFTISNKNGKSFDTEDQWIIVRKNVLSSIQESIKVTLFLDRSYFNTLRKSQYPISCKYQTSSIDENYIIFINLLLKLYEMANKYQRL